MSLELGQVINGDPPSPVGVIIVPLTGLGLEVEKAKIMSVRVELSRILMQEDPASLRLGELALEAGISPAVMDVISRSISSYIIVLREVEGEREFPIWIGQYEKEAIDRRLDQQHHLPNQPVSRPLTHDLLSNVIRDLGGQIDHILVNDLIKGEAAGGTFMAQLVINIDGKQVKIDSRPSDAIALGSATNLPIYVDEHVIDQASGPR